MSAEAAAKRQRLSAEVRREQLMAAAVRVLSLHGYRGATANEISTLAGMSKGLLWHYFDDLDDLFESTARRTLKVLSSAAAATIDLEAPAPVVIRSAIHAATRMRLTHGAERRAMREIVLNLRTADGALRVGQADLEDLYSAQEGIFHRGQTQGDFRADLDPRILAVTYQGSVDSMLEYLDTYPDSDADRHADALADILLGGIKL